MMIPRCRSRKSRVGCPQRLREPVIRATNSRRIHAITPREHTTVTQSWVHSQQGLSAARRGRRACTVECRMRPRCSKTGPNRVLLGKTASELLDHLSKSISGQWGVSARDTRPAVEGGGASPVSGAGVRGEAGVVADARLHDLNPTSLSMPWIARGRRNPMGTRSAPIA